MLTKKQREVRQYRMMVMLDDDGDAIPVYLMIVTERERERSGIIEESPSPSALDDPPFIPFPFLLFCVYVTFSH